MHVFMVNLLNSPQRDGDFLSDDKSFTPSHVQVFDEHVSVNDLDNEFVFV